MNILKSGLLVILAACAAGLGWSAGCHDPHWMTSTPLPIQANDGASYEAALRVGSRQYPEEAWTEGEEDWLRRLEDDWIYTKYGRSLGISPIPEEFQRLMHHTTES